MKESEKQEMEKLRIREEKRKARAKRQNDAYLSKNDRISFDVPKGRKADIQAYCKSHGGISVNAFVSGLVLDVIDGRKTLSEAPEKSPEN